MKEWYVGKVSEFQDRDRILIEVENKRIGVFCKDGKFYAYENKCVHQGGPVCEGMIIGKVIHDLSPQKQVIAERFSEEEIHIVCPWHGWEFDIENGECASDRSLRLNSFKIVQREEDLYVVC